MVQLIDYLPLLIPAILIQFVLAIFALIHVLKHPIYRFGNKILWIIIVIFVQVAGPIIYFIFGRGEE